MTDTRHIPQEDLALYAMQALSREESALVRDHLTACAECRAQLAEVSGDLAAVALSVEQQPLPDGARGRFLARIAADAAPVRTAPAPGPVVTRPSRPPRRVALWISWAAVAALLALAIALQFRIRSLDRQLQQQSAELQRQQAASAHAQAVLDLLTAPNTQHVVLTATRTRPAPTARAVYMPSHGALIMQASNLPPVPAGKTYELWIMPMKGAPVPAGLFRPDPAGNASVVMPELPKGVEAKAFGVTVERAGGSPTPTLPIVLEGAASTPGA